MAREQATINHARVLCDHFKELKSKNPDACLQAYLPREHGTPDTYVFIVDNPFMVAKIYDMLGEEIKYAHE